MKIDHIGIVVKNIDKAKEKYIQLLDYEVKTELIYDKFQKVNVLFLENKFGERIELIEPTTTDSPVYNALKKGGGTNHIGYKTDNLEKSLAEARTEKCIIVREPMPGAGHNNRNVAFVMHPLLGLVEFVELF